MITLDAIKSSLTATNDLAWPFDFDLARAERDHSWLALSPPVEFEIIAGEGAGGVYAAYGPGPIEIRPILFVTSEGQAGRISADLTQLIGMLIAIPYWQDILKFSGGGDLEEMRKAANYMRREYDEDYPELPAARDRIISMFSVPIPDDPIADLHRSVNNTDCSAVASDGWKYESLFNKFTAADNRSWN